MTAEDTLDRQARYRAQLTEAGDAVRELELPWQSADSKHIQSVEPTVSGHALIFVSYEWGEFREEVLVEDTDTLALHAYLTEYLTKKGLLS